jgi:dihydroxyacetone kinase-like predicted kinase
MYKYLLEFVITTYDITEEAIKNSLTEFGEGLEIHNCQEQETRGKDYKININTEDPTAIFDICSQFGRIKTIKINEQGRRL